MHAVVRTYSGKEAKEAWLAAAGMHTKEVENLLRSIKGFVSYTAAQTNDGAFTITVCEDKAGVDESVRLAREWMSKNFSDVSAPTVSEGSVVLHLK